MKIWAIIGARSGSKGIPNKNISMLGGFPLLAYPIETAKRVSSISRIIVSTDSTTYGDIARSFGAEELIRPPELASDKATDYGWIRHIIDTYRNDLPDWMVLLRPTTPFRDPVKVSMAIQDYIPEKCTSLRSVHLLEEHPNKMFTRTGMYLYPFSGGSFEQTNLGRQNFEDVYVPNGYVDILNVKHVLATGNLYGERIKAFLTDRVVEIDTSTNLEWAERLVYGTTINNMLKDKYSNCLVDYIKGKT